MSELENVKPFISLKHIDKIYDNGVQAVFDFNLEDKKTHITIFENGYVPVKDYKAHFYMYKLSVTEF